MAIYVFSTTKYSEYNLFKFSFSFKSFSYIAYLLMYKVFKMYKIIFLNINFKKSLAIIIKI